MATKQQLKRRLRKTKRRKRRIKRKFKQHIATHATEETGESSTSYTAGPLEGIVPDTGTGVTTPTSTEPATSESDRLNEIIELTHEEIATQDRQALRKDNRSLYERNLETNRFGRQRYDLRGDDRLANSTTAAGRAEVIANVNDRLKIKPSGIDPTREVNKNTLRLSKGFQALEDYMSGVKNTVDNTTVRAEIARLREFAEDAGNNKLAKELNRYLTRFTQNKKLKAGSAGNAIASIREIQSHIRDSYNVDWLFEQTNGNYKAALNTNIYRVHEQTQEVYAYATAESRALAEKNAAENEQKWQDSYAGENMSIQDGFRAMQDRIEEEGAEALVESRYQEDQENIYNMPWWARPD